MHIFPQSVGAGFQELAKDNQSSYGINAGYGNLQRITGSFHQTGITWGPEYLSADGNFRVRTSKTGMLKFYGNYHDSHIGDQGADADSAGLLSRFAQTNTNFYSNLSYRESLGNNWKIDAAAAFNDYRNDIARRLLDAGNQPLFLSDYPYNQYNLDSSTRSIFAQGRFVLRKQLAHNQAIRFGAENFYYHDQLASNRSSGDSANTLRNNLIAGFAESDIYITRNMAAKVGLRAEYSSLINRLQYLAPRLALAYRFANGGQINMAYGVFYQMPGSVYIVQNRNLDFSRADHYIVNYQKKAGNRLFRVEAYYKTYQGLVTAYPSYSNGGNGYARGFELFWRDKRTFKNLDYWITYTYLDTKRKYLDFPYSTAPAFSTPHTLSLVAKKYFQVTLNLSANMSYTSSPADGPITISSKAYPAARTSMTRARPRSIT